MMTEQELHKLIKENKKIQKQLISTLNIKGENIIFNSEDQYPNGLLADFSVLDGNEVKAIIELKGSEIGANEYVRGTGQLFQYQHFIDMKLSLKNYLFNNSLSVLCFPSSLLLNKPYNIGLFAYPSNSVILEYNEETMSFRIITKKDLEKFAGKKGKELITISSYYIRDNRIFELYIALRYLQIMKLIGVHQISRNEAEKFLQAINTPNNKNWRNAFISLSSLGLTVEDNITTEIGAKLSNLDYPNFCFQIYNLYIKNYFITILAAIRKLNAEINPISLADLKCAIDFLYRGKEVSFLTDSGTRYLSSWLNLMQDDFRCLTFEKGKPKRTYKITYPIDLYNEVSIVRQISKNKYALNFVNKFYSLFRGF